MKERNKELDIAKGVAIWLVIWGHTIQYCYAGHLDFFENLVFRFIYGFHMPFFMIISGYLFWKSCEKYDLNTIIRKQFQQVMYPMLIWNGINWICKLIYQRGGGVESFHGFVSSMCDSLEGLWFLWSIFIISVLIAFIYFHVSYGIKEIIGYIFGFAVIIMLPTAIEPCKKMNIWMYPYFLTGFLWNRMRTEYLKKSRIYYMRYVAIVLYPILIHYFHTRDYIYISGIDPFSSGYGFLEQIRINIYRWIVGYVGIIFMVVILQELLQRGNIKKFLDLLFGNLGQVTLQVYIIQRLLLEEVFGRVYRIIVEEYMGGENILIQNMILYNIIFTPLIGLLHLFVIYKIIIWIRRNPGLSRHMFGRI